MTCDECGVSAPRRARFCPRCGAPLEPSDGAAAAAGSWGPSRTARLTRAWTVASVVVAVVAVLAVARLVTDDLDPGAATPPPSGSPPGLDVGTRVGDCVGDERGCVAWRLTTAAGGSFTGAALLGDTGYAGVDLRGDGGGVVAFSVSSGEVRWTRRTNRPVQLVPAADDDTVVIIEEPPIGQGSVVHAFEPGTGERRWRSRVSFRVMVAPTVTDGHALIAGYPPAGAAIDLRDPTRTTPLPVTGTMRGPVVTGHGLAYLPLDDRLVAVEPHGGGRGWAVGEGVRIADAVSHGHVLGTDRTGTVVGFDADTGAEAWRTAVDAAGVPPLMADPGLIVARDAEIIVLDPSTGEVRHRRPVPLPAPTVLGAHGGTVYHLTETAIAAVALGDGPDAPPVWSHTFAGDGPRHAPTVSADGTRLVVGTPGGLVAFVP